MVNYLNLFKQKINMKKPIKTLLKALFVIWLLVIFFIYYTNELVHNADHLPLILQKIVEKINIFHLMP